MRFGEVLVQRGLVTESDISDALNKQEELRARGINERLGVLLVVAGKLSAEALADTLVEITSRKTVPPHRRP